jgi:hypothetical protein
LIVPPQSAIDCLLYFGRAKIVILWLTNYPSRLVSAIPLHGNSFRM